jgi:hypothetical protein
MRILRAFLAATLPLLLASEVLGQKGFVPRPPPPPPPVRPPIHPPITPHVPPPVVPLVPHTVKQPSHKQTQRPNPRVDMARFATMAAGTVWLLPAPDGYGALEAAAALVGGETVRGLDPAVVARERAYLKDQAVLVGLTVSLLPSGEGHGVLLASSALVGRETSRIPPPVNLAAPAGQPVARPPAPQSNLVGWLIAGAAGFGLLALVATLVFRRSRCRVRIVDVPPGEAPDYVRRAWVGLELPLAPGQKGPCHMATEGVMSGQEDGETDGYLVLGSEAVTLLAAHDAEAALWWRTHAPHVLVSGYQLVFPTEVCDPM